MITVIKDRRGNTVSSNASQDRFLKFLYKNFFGRVLLKLLVCRFMSKIVGAYMNSRLSRRMIKGFVKNNNIDMSRYEDKKFKSYNDFFTRRLREDVVPQGNSDSLISPCDSKLSVYEITDDSVFYIKNSAYTVAGLLKDAALAQEFKGGLCLIFRLCVDDYHRYCYFDSGKKGKNIFIRGKLHTVNPISLSLVDIYSENCREYTVMETENFGRAVEVEVGAMCVGKIKNLKGECSFKRGEEKGMFEFGGSTIVLLLKKGAAEIDEDILKNSAEGIETVVCIGEKIGSNTK